MAKRKGKKEVWNHMSINGGYIKYSGPPLKPEQRQKLEALALKMDQDGTPDYNDTEDDERAPHPARRGEG